VCLILDANIIHKVFPSAAADHLPVQEALTCLRATMVYGGQLRREYVQIGWFRAFLRRLDQTGAAKIFPDDEVDIQTEVIRHAGGYRSDDPHILALAIVANVRLLCSEDHDLSTDFTNRDLIRDPRGSVYRRAEHAHLLRRHCREQAR
jgi:hypothetical protein